MPNVEHDLVLCTNTRCPFNKRDTTISLMYNICTLPDKGNRRLVIDSYGKCEIYLIEVAQGRIKE